MEYIPIFFIFLLIYLINNLFLKKNLISNYSGQLHQTFTGKEKVPLSGGIFILIFCSFIFFSLGYLYVFFIFFIFLIGLFSDLNIISSVKIRFLTQVIIVSIFVYLLDITVEPTRVDLIDNILSNKSLSLIFSIFCLLIVINGSNFIDGLNGLVLGYYSLIFGLLLKLNFFSQINIDSLDLNYFGLVIIYLYFLNLFNRLFIGDSGAYLLGLFFALLLIKIYELDNNFSPFFVILLLWMPCFENLFSIIRKFVNKTSPTSPDNSHFHQLFFLFIRKNFNIKNHFANNLSSTIILFYNLVIFYLASTDIYNTKFQILLISLNIIVYLYTYKILLNYKTKNL